ncbi:MAG: RluA family pseudouridine synthase [Deltaproteobacteria bacterium]|nr:RluA family pseudouridine synthase [Deltaproteobacteria bacterium]
MSFPEILYEDNHIIAINKPAGYLSQSDGSSAPDVLNSLKAFIKQRDSKPGNVYLGLVHRLDRPVSGVLVIARTSKSASRLSAAFRERTVIKMYRAVVQGDVTRIHHETAGRLVHRLLRDERTRISQITDQEGKPASLSWRVLRTALHRSWIEVALETGLPHQIRAQLAAVGHPIVGDRKYGAKQTILNEKGVIALYCHEMQVPHPISGNTFSVRAPSPAFWKDL